MNSEDVCFIHKDEIYYEINANNKEIDHELQLMVEHYMRDSSEFIANTVIQAQMCLILRQKESLLKKHC